MPLQRPKMTSIPNSTLNSLKGPQWGYSKERKQTLYPIVHVIIVMCPCKDSKYRLN